jgi:hypothetical protein
LVVKVQCILMISDYIVRDISTDTIRNNDEEHIPAGSVYALFFLLGLKLVGHQRICLLYAENQDLDCFLDSAGYNGIS